MRDEDFFHSIGTRIADLRQQAGFSQQQLADLLGLKQQTWATYESATRRLFLKSGEVCFQRNKR